MGDQKVFVMCLFEDMLWRTEKVLIVEIVKKYQNDLQLVNSEY